MQKVDQREHSRSKRGCTGNAGCESHACIIPPGWHFVDKTAVNTNWSDSKGALRANVPSGPSGALPSRAETFVADSTGTTAFPHRPYSPLFGNGAVIQLGLNSTIRIRPNPSS